MRFIDGENPNKTLEGIKTFMHGLASTLTFQCENPNKTLEGIKTFAAYW
ncbi:hypothetical protein U27_01424 [Candidatus Vecturithrix granuli]|uniref:Uncharacterized protein n=1 Tax=Vecturithrix granuli TaxID=1499967 RepID=A0A081CAB8_VECG1|nr:hypothetical protein U27_01424 [Candidatus Vecturithrix granuli]